MPDGAAELTYPERLRGLSLPLARGASCDPGQWHVLRQVRVLGSGADDFSEARQRIMTWQMHRGAGFRVESKGDAELGRRVSVSVGVGPLTFVAPCEVVAVVDDENESGFAYGTLPGHPERGEEAFLVRFRNDEVVVGAVAAFSLPASQAVSLAGPAARYVQRVSARRYLGAMLSTTSA
jgi:uncharacterized protein (UPF0548 family)